MSRRFSEVMNSLRRSRGISQRKAASDLGVSQALLSHYENDAREPGLDFVIRACDYYGVTADYLLGRTDDAASSGRAEDLKALSEELRRAAERLDALAEENK